MPEIPTERRHAPRYKPAVAVRAAYEWFDAAPVIIEGAITDFSVAGVALQYDEAGAPGDLAGSGRVCLRLGHKIEHFDVTLARLIRKSGGHWLAGLSFAKRKESRSRARGVIEHLKSAYRAGAVQARHSQDGPVASVLGNLNFNVVLSLHRLLRSALPPRLIDLGQCTGADHSGIEFLLLMSDQCVELKLDPNGRIAELIQRQRDAAAALTLTEPMLIPV